MTYSGILFQIFLAVGCLDVVVYIGIGIEADYQSVSL